MAAPFPPETYSASDQGATALQWAFEHRMPRAVRRLVELGLNLHAGVAQGLPGELVHAGHDENAKEDDEGDADPEVSVRENYDRSVVDLGLTLPGV